MRTQRLLEAEKDLIAIRSLSEKELTLKDRLEQGKLAAKWVETYAEELIESSRRHLLSYLSIPKNTTGNTRKPEVIDEIMVLCPADHRRFCGGGPCACMGAVNCSFEGKLNRKEWEDWKARHPELVR